MSNCATKWWRRTTAAMLALCFLLFSGLGHARPLPVAFLCTSSPLFKAAQVPATGWQDAPGGAIELQSAYDACWIRLLELPRPGEQLTVKNGWADVILHDAQGKIIAHGNRSGTRYNAVVSANHVMMEGSASWTAPLYLRVATRMENIPIPAAVAVGAQASGAVLAEDGDQTNISLAVAVAVLVVAFFSAAFSVVLRDAAYAWMALYLTLSVVIRVFNSAEPLIFMLTSSFDHPRLVWQMMYPLNAIWMLAYARVGDFSLHAPSINRLCQLTAILYLLLIPVFLLNAPLGVTANVVLILMLSYPLLFAGCWIAWRKGSAAAGILFLSNLMLAVFWAPGQFNLLWPSETVSRFIEGNSQLGSLTSVLGVASDLLMPLLFCIALVMRTFGLKQAAVRLMSHDALTGMANREQIRRTGTAMLKKHSALAVLVLNIDRFRLINGALGPEIGDQLLVVTGTRLAAIEGGAVGRLHADQFCLLWPDMAGLADLRERIERDFSKPVDVHGQMVDLTLSIGIAGATAEPATMAQLLRRAETALDAARAVHLPWMEYQADLEDDLRADLGLLSELNRAVEEGQLRMHLQPKVHLPGGAVTSAEALVRWRHPLRGDVPPVEFIPFAERTGRIHLITQWMLGEAMRLCARLRAQGTPLQISVNISTADLAKAGFVDSVQSLCKQCGALPEDIRLEVTESAAMQDPAAALLIMYQLRREGFSLSIDDFGTGYSSLAYLQKMPVAELKIDRSFISDVVAGTDAAVLLQSTIELGHRLGLSVVAEGAETAAEWNLLVELGCDYVQGYYAARPMAVDDFLNWRAACVPFHSQPVPGRQPLPM